MSFTYSTQYILPNIKSFFFFLIFSSSSSSSLYILDEGNRNSLSINSVSICQPSSADHSEQINYLLKTHHRFLFNICGTNLNETYPCAEERPVCGDD